jgi:hypothetical protein
MKKLLGIVVLGLLLSTNVVFAGGINELNKKLLEIEKRITGWRLLIEVEK